MILSNCIKKSNFNRNLLLLFSRNYCTTTKNSSEENKKLTKNLLYSFGSGENYRLGISSLEDKFLPQHVSHLPPFINIKEIGSSWLNSFLLTSEGQVYMWGINKNGNMGLPSETYRFPQILDIIKSVEISKVSIGRSFSMLLTKDEKVLTFGSNEFGQLGSGGKHNQTAPTIVESLKPHPIIDIGTGLDHSIAVTNSGHVYGWGYNVEGQIGQKIVEYKTVQNSSDRFEDEELRQTFKPDQEYRLPTLIPELEKIKISKVVCGSDSTFLISARGNVYGFGSNEIGSLGIGDDENTIGRITKPTKIHLPNQEKVLNMSAGSSHTLFLTTNGNVYSCGWGSEGRLGLGDNTSNRPLPTPIQYFKENQIKIIKVSAGGAHSLALSDDGRVYSWGCGSNGKLGHGNETYQNLPKQIDYFKGKFVKNIYAGIDVSLVVVEN